MNHELINRNLKDVKDHVNKGWSTSDTKEFDIVLDKLGIVSEDSAVEKESLTDVNWNYWRHK